MSYYGNNDRRFSIRLNTYISPKVANSTTYTKPLSQKQDNFMIEDTPVGVKTSYVKVLSGNPPVRRQLANTFQYKDQYTTELSWLGNQKRYSEICGYGTRSQYLGTTSGSTNMCNNSYMRFFDFQINQLNTGGTIVASNAINDWMSIDNVLHHMDILNETNLPCELTFYWYKSLDDQYVSPIQDYDIASGYNQVFIDPFIPPTTFSLPSQAGGEVSTFTSGTGSVLESIVTFPYTNLAARSDVKKNYRVIKKHKVILASGDVHRVTAFIDLNVFQNGSALEINTDRFPKGSVYCVASVQGLATHVSTTDNEIVCLAPGNVTILNTRQFNLKPLAIPENRYDPKYLAVGNIKYNATIANTKNITMTDVIGQVGVSV